MAETNQMTAAAHARLVEEIEELEGPVRRAIAARIKTAREWGDLKENAEYHAAKDEAAMLEARIKRLKARLGGAEVVAAAGGEDGAGMGSTVTFTDAGSGKEATYTFVSALDARPAEGRLSIDSPVGAALRGARPGDTREYETPSGVRTVSVTAVEHG